MRKDIVILGTGPAGIQAAIHAARKKMDTVVLGKIFKSSLESAHVENYCCIQGVSKGSEMLEQGIAQAKNFGAVFLEVDVIKISKNDTGLFVIETEGEESIEAKALIMAIGVARNSLKVKGEKEYHGKGVSYCVECDANFFKGKKVAIVGDGSAAASGAVLMTMYASSVTLFSKKINVSEKLMTQMENTGVIVRDETWISEILGDGHKVEAIKDTLGGITQFDGVFIELGSKGAVELAASLGVELDSEEFKYIKTDKKQATNIEGVYAAGDICGAPFQLAKAVGEGCVAGLSAAQYVNEAGEWK